MKTLLLLAAAFACSTSTAFAQTVLPSGAVAPTGSVTPSGVPVTPATVPGAQPLVTPATRDAGSPRASRRDEKVPGISREDRKRMRKMGKMKYNSNASKQSGNK